MKYIIISPVRNEEKYIRKTINSVISQSITPTEWIIVNDGSTDKTEEIVKSYIATNSWIRIINKKDRGFTEVGKGVMEAFRVGFNNISVDDWDFIVKLDCDVELENDYFEELLKEYGKNSNLGIAGGTSYVFEQNKLYEEKMPKYHPWAGARIYRRKCFEQIGRLTEVLGWDTIDLLRAQMEGWETKRFSKLKIIHLRRMSSRKGLWEGKVRLGRNFYITGYHPLFLFMRSMYRLFERPYFVESFGVFVGYFEAMFKQEPLVVTEKEKNFLRKQQLKRLLGIEVQ